MYSWAAFAVMVSFLYAWRIFGAVRKRDGNGSRRSESDWRGAPLPGVGGWRCSWRAWQAPTSITSRRSPRSSSTCCCSRIFWRGRGRALGIWRCFLPVRSSTCCSTRRGWWRSRGRWRWWAVRIWAVYQFPLHLHRAGDVSVLDGTGVVRGARFVRRDRAGAGNRAVRPASCRRRHRRRISGGARGSRGGIRGPGVPPPRCRRGHAATACSPVWRGLRCTWGCSPSAGRHHPDGFAHHLLSLPGGGGGAAAAGGGVADRAR